MSYQFSLEPQKVTKLRTRFRYICTDIPSPQSLDIIRETMQYGPNHIHGQLPVAWHGARDWSVFDPAGNKWIDFTSGIFVANVGHSNPKVRRAIQDQADKHLLHAYNYPTEIKYKFLNKLLAMSPTFCEKGLLFSAGTEATEASIQLMKLYGKKKNKHRIDIISFQGAMHGITMGAEMMKGNPEILDLYDCHDDHFHRIPFPYFWEDGGDKNFDWTRLFYQNLEDLLTLKRLRVDYICGFMIEAYRGWGALFYPKPYIQALCEFAKNHQILVTIDDIQGGCARTGKMFAFQHYDIEPDLVCIGKGLSSSLPLSAVIGRSEIIDLPEISGSWHSTHSGNPVCCAAGLANLEEIETHNLINKSARKGELLFKRLEAIRVRFPNRISYISGNGLLAAVLFKNPTCGEADSDFPSRVCERAMQKGLLLVHTGRESIKIAPPLTIPEPVLEEGISVLEESIAEIDAASAY